MKNLITVIVACTVSSGVTAVAAQQLQSNGTASPAPTKMPALDLNEPPFPRSTRVSAAQADAPASVALAENGVLTVTCGGSSLARAPSQKSGVPDFILQCAKSQNPDHCFRQESNRIQRAAEEARRKEVRAGSRLYIGKDDGTPAGGMGGPRGYAVERATKQIRETLEALVADALIEKAEQEKRQACASSGRKPDSCD